MIDKSHNPKCEHLSVTFNPSKKRSGWLHGEWLCAKCGAKFVMFNPIIAHKLRRLAQIDAAFHAAWKCKADPSSGFGNDPLDCNWPTCGCDDYATNVINKLSEQGWCPVKPIPETE